MCQKKLSCIYVFLFVWFDRFFVKLVVCNSKLLPFKGSKMSWLCSFRNYLCWWRWQAFIKKKKPCSLTPLVIFIRACLQCKFSPNLSCNPAGAKTQEKSKKRESMIACNNQSFLFEWSHYRIIINYTCLHESKGAHLWWYSELAKARPVQL